MNDQRRENDEAGYGQNWPSPTYDSHPQNESHSQPWERQTYQEYSRGTTANVVQLGGHSTERQTHIAQPTITNYYPYQNHPQNHMRAPHDQHVSSTQHAFGISMGTGTGSHPVPPSTEDRFSEQSNQPQTHGSYRWDAETNSYIWVPSSNASRAGYGTGQSYISGDHIPTMAQLTNQTAMPSAQQCSSHSRENIEMSLDATNSVDQGTAGVLHCPYGCGTVLTGVHAADNLTRHLKSQTCTSKRKSRDKYLCPVIGCGKAFTWSVRLKAHLWKSHPKYHEEQSYSWDIENRQIKIDMEEHLHKIKEIFRPIEGGGRSRIKRVHTEKEEQIIGENKEKLGREKEAIIGEEKEQIRRQNMRKERRERFRKEEEEWIMRKEVRIRRKLEEVERIMREKEERIRREQEEGERIKREVKDLIPENIREERKERFRKEEEERIIRKEVRIRGKLEEVERIMREKEERIRREQEEGERIKRESKDRIPAEVKESTRKEGDEEGDDELRGKKSEKNHQMNEETDCIRRTEGGSQHWQQGAESVGTMKGRAELEQRKPKLSDGGWLYSFEQAIQIFLVATGLIERQLEVGKVRLRWQCRCGAKFYSDVTEHHENGISKLVSHMHRATDTRILSMDSQDTNGRSSRANNNFRQLSLRVSNTMTGLASVFRRSPKGAHLPQHNACASVTVSSSNTNSCQRTLHLMSCVQQTKFRKDLYQDRIDSLTTDRALLCFLKRQYKHRRGRFLTHLSLKCIKGISFVKFQLPAGGSVEVRHHGRCCSPGLCHCLPPKGKVEPSPDAEYSCFPYPPPVFPPVLPEYLMHLLESPSCIEEQDTWILNQLPKRTCGELRGQRGQPAEGWGIDYEEDWNTEMISLLIFLLFFIWSLLFGVLWSRFKMDLQGAFGVSSYFITACAIILSLVANRLG